MRPSDCASWLRHSAARASIHGAGTTLAMIAIADPPRRLIPRYRTISYRSLLPIVRAAVGVISLLGRLRRTPSPTSNQSRLLTTIDQSGSVFANLHRGERPQGARPRLAWANCATIWWPHAGDGVPRQAPFGLMTPAAQRRAVGKPYGPCF